MMELNESILTLLEKTNPGAFAIMSVTAEGIKLRYVSEEAAKIVGMTQEECLEAGGKDALRMVVQEERQRITALADQCLRDREDMDAIYHVRHKTKGVTLIRTKGRMIGSIDGEAYLYVAVTDIAGEKETSLNCCPQDNTDIKLDQQRYLDFFRSLNQAYPVILFTHIPVKTAVPSVIYVTSLQTIDFTAFQMHNVVGDWMI